MPELPEVETILRAIRPILIGQRIHSIDVLRPAMTLPSPQSLIDNVTNTTVKAIERRGKYLLLTLDNDYTLVLHLRMSGRLGLRGTHDPQLRYERIRFCLSDGQILVFNDPRTLGRAHIIKTKNIDASGSFRNLGPDALIVTFAAFSKRLICKKGKVKAVLLDQSFVAGIGNIYADEALFLARIHPDRPAASLNDDEKTRLHRAIITTLEKGIENMGTSFSDFADLFGKPGKNQHSLAVYGRAGKECRVCASVLKRTVVGQRGTVWCAKCQR